MHAQSTKTLNTSRTGQEAQRRRQPRAGKINAALSASVDPSPGPPPCFVPHPVIRLSRPALRIIATNQNIYPLSRLFQSSYLPELEPGDLASHLPPATNLNQLNSRDCYSNENPRLTHAANLPQLEFTVTSSRTYSDSNLTGDPRLPH